ncbi:MAG: TetR/AcrR family transcriptional regulator [Planctomycetes bacterium]|nr:TetR/AcrR family transcriptional regulator [Planctomycetota bacterium]
MGRKKSYDRDETAERALHVFWEKGFEQTSLKDLEAATGVNRYGLYDSFTDKQGLFRECLTGYCASVMAMIEGFTSTGFSGLLGVIERFAEADFEEVHLHHGCLAITSMLEKECLSEDLQQLLGGYMDGILGAIRATLESEKKAGVLRKDLDIEDCMGLMHLIMVGLPTLSRTSPDADAMRRGGKSALNAMRTWLA